MNLKKTPQTQQINGPKDTENVSRALSTFI